LRFPLRAYVFDRRLLIGHVPGKDNGRILTDPQAGGFSRRALVHEGFLQSAGGAFYVLTEKGKQAMTIRKREKSPAQ